MTLRSIVVMVATATLNALPATATAADQSALPYVVNAGTETLRFDWPAIHIGTGEYPDGPTGVTVFHFPKRAYGAVDVRGGGPGTVNTDYLRLGYDTPEVDAIVFSGGSWYGLESVTAVATALKDDGVRNDNWDNVALSVGAIIYDLGDRRLNQIYPDKRLAQAAFRAARPAEFPLGAHGAGRFAKTGALFGCNAYSGQGGAFRQIGDLKIAAFVVVNALGVVTGRDGRVAACYRDTSWPANIRAADLLAAFPADTKPGAAVGRAADEPRRNTTVSLIVTNQRLEPSALQRLATHVHSSMSRAIQPFATEFDGDVLYAVSTGERPADATAVPTVQLDVLAAEVMWDAILASVPAQPPLPVPGPERSLNVRELADRAGDYRFSAAVSVRISGRDGRLNAQALGRRAYAIPLDAPVALLTVSATTFTVPGRYPVVLDFATPGRVVINPGPWAQTGMRAGAGSGR